MIRSLLVGDEVRDCIVIKISGSEYDHCVRSSHDFWGNKKGGTYGRGLGRTIQDPYGPARIGNLGRLACGKLLQQEPDLSYKEKGDEGGIFLLGDERVKVTCTMKNYNGFFILHTSESGMRQKITSDYYIYAYAVEDIDNQCADIVFVGFCTKDMVLKSPVAKGRRGGKHLNYTISGAQTIPMYDLIGSVEHVT